METELNIDIGRNAILVVLLRLDAYRSSQTLYDMRHGTLGVVSSMNVARIVPNSRN